MTDYQQQLHDEAELWGADAEAKAQTVPPDWRYHRDLRHNAIYHRADIDEFLGYVWPGMTALELGCGSGWLTLALAQRGAQATGIDISDRALQVARAYYDTIRDEVPGSVTYTAADLNALDLPAEAYDVIAVKGTLHHLLRMDHVVAQIHRALKPGGLLWVSDSHGDEAALTVLAASALMFVLPTHVSYRDKFSGLRRFGLNAPSRVKASIQAEGLSPFEGAGRDFDWLALIEQRFRIIRRIPAPAVTGYITHQINLPDALARPLLRGLCLADRALVALGLLRPTGLIIYARKL